MSSITEHSTVEEIAAVVSGALENAGINATLSGGSAVTIYSDNAYQSRDLDFVTSAMLADLKSVLEPLKFEHTGGSRLSQFSHPDLKWYLEFVSAPLAFGNLEVSPDECDILELPSGRLRIITPTQSVMDRLAAAYAWNDPQARDQALLVAANQPIDWKALRSWFADEGESDEEFQRFEQAARAEEQK